MNQITVHKMNAFNDNISQDEASQNIDNHDSKEEILWEDDDNDLIAACEEWESSTNKTVAVQSLHHPLTQIRSGYLWVSDLCSQMWCEQQFEYKLTAPTKEPETEHMAKGTELHLARELETQDYVDVKITSDEDIFAVKVINLTHALIGFVQGSIPVSREVPIFGTLGDSDTFFLGKIDEINTYGDNSSLQIVEFKTRISNSLPGKSQKKTHEIQVMAYKSLICNLIHHGLKPEKVYSTLNLNGKKSLGKDVLSHCKTGLNEDRVVSCLDDLINILNNAAKFLSVNVTMKINYTSQKDGKCFAEEIVIDNETWFLSQIDALLRYWNGEKKTEGVDIEDAWKCQNCHYADECTWRKAKAEDLAKKNQKKITL